MSADLGLNDVQKTYCREAIAKAGTILVSSTGHAYFELTHLSPEDKGRLQKVLGILGGMSGSRLWPDMVHPVTGNKATLMLELNALQTEPEKAQSVLNGLYASGNVYAYPETPSKSGLKFSIDTPKADTTFLGKCAHVVRSNDPSVNGWVQGRSLFHDVLDGIAVHTNVTSVLDNSEAVVPASLYAADPVKASVVHLILQQAAHLGKGALSMHYGAAVGHTQPVHYYKITGAAVDRLDGLSKSVDLADGLGLRRDSVVLDAFRLSAPGHAGKITPIIERESLGEFMTNIGIRTPVTEIEGVPLFGTTPR